MIKFLAKNIFVLVFIMVFVVNAILDKVFNIDNFLIRIVVITVVGLLLFPRRKIIETETGKKIQITWFLLKEPIFIDK